MNESEIKLMSDVVKLGIPALGTILGGIVGAFSTYFFTRLNYANDSTKETRKKRLELLLQIANDIAEFEHLSGTYAMAISNHVQGLEGSHDIEAAREAIINKAQPLRRARMTIKLLGLLDAEEQLEKYVELTREVFAKGPYQKMPRASEIAKIIARGPVDFYAALGKELQNDQHAK